MSEPRFDRDSISFVRAILGRPAPFTTVFLVANVCLFILTIVAGGAGSNNTLIALGAKLNFLIDEKGQWWRFVTPIFLHGGLLHLLFNMYGLWIIGPYVEKLYGSSKFVVIWVVTGIAGVVASYLSVRPDLSASFLGRFIFKSVDSPSIGASGALFGLVGVLFVFGIRFRHELPEGFKRAFGTGMLPIIVINLFIGFAGRGFINIDNAAHLGGLISGALIALVVGYQRPGPRDGAAFVWLVLQVGALGLVVLSFFMVWRHYDGPPLSLSPTSLSRAMSGNRSADGSAAHIRAINSGIKAFDKALKGKDVSGIDPAIKTIDSSPSLSNDADAIRQELKSLLERVRALATSPAPGNDPIVIRQRNELLVDYEAWDKKRLNWVKTEGGRYGIELIKNAEPGASPSN